MKYFTKTSLGPSKSYYKHHNTEPIHGTGQGSCASPSLIDFKYDQTGNPIMFPPDHTPLHLNIEDSQQPHYIQQMQQQQAHKTLGCYKSLDGNESEQFQILLRKSKDWAHKLTTRYFTRHESWMVYHSYYLPQMLYSMTATDLTKTQCETLQSPVLSAILPLLGYNWNTSRRFIFGPAKFGCLGLADLYTEMYSQRLESIISHILSRSSIGNLMTINLGYLNLLSDKSIPYLESKTPIKYIQKNWFSGIHTFIIENEISINVSESWTPTIEREQDAPLIDSASGDDCSRLTVINNWRIYFRIVLISDLLNAEGTKVESIYLQYPRSDCLPCHPSRTSLLHWPSQGKPSERSFTYW
jgi:hypothetical protein